MSANDISVLVGMICVMYIGGEIGYGLAANRRISPAEASQTLASESKRIRKLMKPQRRYIPYVG